MTWINVWTWLWLLGIGVFVYSMMKSRGSRQAPAKVSGPAASSDNMDPTEPAPTRAPLVRDPVCSMEIELTDSAGTRTVGGRRFYFCSRACLEEFDLDPEGFARRAEAESPSAHGGAAGHHGHGGCC
ncbi:MAG TPA: YHS domain-containing protein [Polyangiaceae bacterium]|nr:YHS domain-containing protein [Polyangiaceae bacterium]